MSSVAIVGGMYCSGGLIAKQVADRLGFKSVGQELLVETAAKYGTSVKKLARALTGSRPFFDGLTHDQDESLIYIRAALAELVSADNLVYRGVAAHLIPSEITHMLRVCLVADREHRVQRAAERDGVDAKEAESNIQKSDQELAALTQLIHKRGPWDSTLFDIKIPIHSAGVDGAVDLICDALSSDALRATGRSLQAAADFRLATAVNLELIKRGHHYCDVTAHKGELMVAVRRKPSSWGQLGRVVSSLRFEQLEDDIKELATTFEGVKEVEVRPGSWHKKVPKTLLVDDEREYVMTLSERLQMRDIPSAIAYDGLEALEQIAADAPDVMVLDLKMPGMDGMEVLRQVREDNPNIKVIVVTGHGSEEHERAALELGAFAYLEKPVDIKVLAKTIQDASGEEVAGMDSEDDDPSSYSYE